MSIEKQQKSTSSKDAMSRRALLQGALATGVIISGGLLLRQQSNETHLKKEHVNELTFLSPEKRPKPYPTGVLSGIKFNQQFTRYIGTESRLKDVELIDFKYQLATLWEAKYKKMRGDEPEEEYSEHHPGVVEAMEHIYRDYKSPESGKGDTLDSYRRRIDDTVASLEGTVDWKRVEKVFVLSENQSSALRRFAPTIDADLLLSYAITELMPSMDGTINANFFEFLLKNGGRGYVESIPALGDRLLSFGPYQFTSAALSNGLAKSGKVQRNGASMMDALLKKSVLPPNVASLRGDDHHRAAYLFALYNVVHLVKDLGNDRCADSLKQDSSFINTALRDYVVAAHHRPTNARHAFSRLLESKKRPHPSGAEKTLGEFCATDVHQYVKKTRSNRAALLAR